MDQVRAQVSSVSNTKLNSSLKNVQTIMWNPSSRISLINTEYLVVIAVTIFEFYDDRW